MKIYWANGLFSAADRMFNDYCYDKLIQAGIREEDIYMPQKNMAINNKMASATSKPIYCGDTKELMEADILVAVLDGVSIDAGVASEVGWVAGWNEYYDKMVEYAPEDEKYLPKGKKVILGLYTDNRDLSNTAAIKKFNDSKNSGVAENQWPYANLYTVGACKTFGTIYWTLDKLIEILVKIYNDENCNKGN